MKRTILTLMACAGLALSALTFTACGGNSGEPEKEMDGEKRDTSAQTAYICPCGGCPEVKESAPGKCPKCQMDLVEEKH